MKSISVLLISMLSFFAMSTTAQTMSWFETENGQPAYSLGDVIRGEANPLVRVVSCNKDTAENWQSDWMPLYQSGKVNDDLLYWQTSVMSSQLGRSVPDSVWLINIIILSNTSVRFVVGYSGQSTERWIRVNFGPPGFVNQFNTISYYAAGNSDTLNIEQFDNLNPGTNYTAKAFEHWPQVVSGVIVPFTMPNGPPPCTLTTTITCGDLDLCPGQTTNLVAVPSIPINECVSITWSNGVTGQYNNNVGPGTYTVTVTSCCCTATYTVTIVPAPPPSVTITQTGNLDCGSGSVTLFANCSVSGSTFKWFRNGILVSTQQWITETMSGQYTVEVTTPDGCTASDSRTVQPPGGLQVTVTANGNVGCSGQTMTLTANLNVNPTGAIFLWTLNNVQVGNQQTINVSQPGNYIVFVTTASGCSATCIYDIAAPPLPVCTITCGNTYFPCGPCTGVDLSVPYVQGYTYLWSNGGNGSSTIVFESGTYSVTVTNQFGCKHVTSFPVNITYGTQPVIIHSPLYVATCPGQTVALFLNAPGYENFQLITWSPFVNMTDQYGPTTLVAPWTDQIYTGTISIPSGIPGVPPCIYVYNFIVDVCGDGVTVDTSDPAQVIVDVKPFPNPTASTFKVDLPPGEYKVFLTNEQGQRVHEFFVTGSFEYLRGPEVVDGIYFLSVVPNLSGIITTTKVVLLSRT